jgi:hypothetical protein
VVALLALVCTAGAARAETVDITVGSWQDRVLVRPTSIESTIFFATSAGAVTLSLLDARVLTPQWGQVLSNLSGTVTMANGSRLPLANGAVAMFQIAANESFSASIYAAVASSTGYGAYQFDLLFVPSAAPVPLPPALWSLLAGLGLLATRSRRVRLSPRATSIGNTNAISSLHEPDLCRAAAVGGGLPLCR